MRMVPSCGYLLWCLLMAQASLQLDIGKIVVPQISNLLFLFQTPAMQSLVWRLKMVLRL
jgi:hypothetical protein